MLSNVFYGSFISKRLYIVSFFTTVNSFSTEKVGQDSLFRKKYVFFEAFFMHSRYSLFAN